MYVTGGLATVWSNCAIIGGLEKRTMATVSRCTTPSALIVSTVVCSIWPSLS